MWERLVRKPFFFAGPAVSGALLIVLRLPIVWLIAAALAYRLLR